MVLGSSNANGSLGFFLAQEWAGGDQCRLYSSSVRFVRRSTRHWLGSTNRGSLGQTSVCFCSTRMRVCVCVCAGRRAHTVRFLQHGLQNISRSGCRWACTVPHRCQITQTTSVVVETLSSLWHTPARSENAGFRASVAGCSRGSVVRGDQGTELKRVTEVDRAAARPCGPVPSLCLILSLKFKVNSPNSQSCSTIFDIRVSK